MNPYSYLMNNPLSGTDPTGYSAESALCQGGSNMLGCGKAGGMSQGQINASHNPQSGLAAAIGELGLTGNPALEVANGAGTLSGSVTVNDIGDEKEKSKQSAIEKDRVAKQLTSAEVQLVDKTYENLKKSAKKLLEELRKTPEFSTLESKYGAVILTFNDDEETGIIGNTININKWIFSLEYEVDASASLDAYMGTLPDSMSNDDYYNAVDKYEQSLPNFHAFSMNRVIAHEAFHLMQGNISGLDYTLNKQRYEAVNIRRTNEFMFKYYNEPYRDENHGAARSK
ncbi:MAG: hypothetical protein MK193_15535 [Lentisphaeria bacterium]|nr:hypothetical protein [Lentisphaeria bacterium]